MNRAARIVVAAMAAAGMAGVASAQAQPAQPAAQQPRPEVAKTHLKVGDAAPDFKLKGSNGKTFKLSSFKNKKNVVLAFYVLAFTGG